MERLEEKKELISYTEKMKKKGISQLSFRSNLLHSGLFPNTIEMENFAANTS